MLHKVSAIFKSKKVLFRWMALLLAIGLGIPAGPVMAATKQNVTATMEDATGALLVEANTQQPLLEREADTPRSVAGLSKLPAVLVLCEAVDRGDITLNDEIVVSDKASRIGGPSAFIEGGESIRAAALMKAVVMIGAGDAILALGETAYGNETEFIARIQERLQELGVDITTDNALCTGVQFSPRQLAVLGAALMQSPCFAAHSKLTLENISHQDGRETELVNANRMLRIYAGCTGVATGSSAEDGYCGIFYVARGDTQLICVTLGCRNANMRFALAGSMLDQIFATTKAQCLASAGDVIAENVRVRGGTRREVNLVAKDTVILLLDKSEPALTPTQNIPDRLQAPLDPQQVVGDIVYKTADGVEKGRVELVAQTMVEQAFFRDIIRQLLLCYIRQ